MEILLYVGLVLLGFAAGTLGSLLGLGGGFLVVPALILLRGMDDRLATGTSIAVIVPAMLTALWRRGAQGDVDFAVAAWVAVGAVGGAFLGSHIARTIDPTTLRRLFAGILVVLAFVLVMKKPPARTPAPATSGAGDAGQLPPNLAGPPMGGTPAGIRSGAPGRRAVLDPLPGASYLPRLDRAHAVRPRNQFRASVIGPKRPREAGSMKERGHGRPDAQGWQAPQADACLPPWSRAAPPASVRPLQPAGPVASRVPQLRSLRRARGHRQGNGLTRRDSRGVPLARANRLRARPEP